MVRFQQSRTLNHLKSSKVPGFLRTEDQGVGPLQARIVGGRRMARILVVVCLVCMWQLVQELEVLVFVGSASLSVFARGVLELEKGDQGMLDG